MRGIRLVVLAALAVLLCAGTARAGQSWRCNAASFAFIPGDAPISCKICPTSPYPCIVNAVFTAMRLNNACGGGALVGWITPSTGSASYRVDTVIPAGGVNIDRAVLPHPLMLDPGGCVVFQFPGYIAECGMSLTGSADCNYGGQD